MRRLTKKLYVASTELYINRRTRASIKAAAVRLDAILDAWEASEPTLLEEQYPDLAAALKSAQDVV